MALKWVQDFINYFHHIYMYHFAQTASHYNTVVTNLNYRLATSLNYHIQLYHSSNIKSLEIYSWSF
jgi:hypothetical protein